MEVAKVGFLSGGGSPSGRFSRITVWRSGDQLGAVGVSRARISGFQVFRIHLFTSASVGAEKLKSWEPEKLHTNIFFMLYHVDM